MSLREDVLRASVALIHREGLAALSMRRVAREAGVSHQAPYHYFADREAILAALAQEGFESLARSLSRSRAVEGPLVQLRALMRAYVAFALERPAHFRIMFRPELVDLERFPDAQAAGAAAHSVLEAAVHDCIEAGIFPELARDAVTTLIWSLPHGMCDLLLDGPLGRQLTTKRARLAHVDDVLAVFIATLEGRGHASS